MGGAQYQAKVLAQRMMELGQFELHYLTRRMPEQHNEPGISLHRIGTSKNMYFLFDAPGIRRTLTKLQPDIIYAHVGCAYVGIAAHFCRTHKAKLVWHLASDIDIQRWTPKQRRNMAMSFIDKKVMEYGLRNADHIIAQSQLQADELNANYGRRASAIVKNFHPPVKESCKKSGQLKVVWVANLKTVKRPQEFVDLARRLQHLPAQFELIGGMQLSEDKEQLLLNKIQELPNCHYIGPISQDEVNQKLAEAHLLVNTSSYEGFSNTFIQAWQRKVPVCSLSVDPDNLLSEKQLGTYAAGDPVALKKDVEDLLLDEQKRMSYGLEAEAYAAEHHSIAAADRLIEFFR